MQISKFQIHQEIVNNSNFSSQNIILILLYTNFHFNNANLIASHNFVLKKFKQVIHSKKKQLSQDLTIIDLNFTL